MVTIQQRRDLNEIVIIDFVVGIMGYLFTAWIILRTMFGIEDLSNSLISAFPFFAMFLLIVLLSFRDQVKLVVIG